MKRQMKSTSRAIVAGCQSERAACAESAGSQKASMTWQSIAVLRMAPHEGEVCIAKQNCASGPFMDVIAMPFSSRPSSASRTK